MRTLVHVAETGVGGSPAAARLVWLSILGALAAILLATTLQVSAQQFSQSVWNLRNEQKQLPKATAERIQAALRQVGCPDWKGTPGAWGPNAAKQFRAFLKATGQERRYRRLQPSSLNSVLALFNSWTQRPDFKDSLAVTHPDYCEPVGSQQVTSQTVDADLRDPQSRLPERVAIELQNALARVGCPAYGSNDGIWGPHSSRQFHSFLRKTQQLVAYNALSRPQLRDILKLFESWGAKADFDVTIDEGHVNHDPTYCEPIAGCNFSAEIESIFASNEAEHKEIRELYLKVNDLNTALSEGRYAVGRGIIPAQDLVCPEDEDAKSSENCSSDGQWLRRNLQIRMYGLQVQLRSLFIAAAANRNDACNSCLYRPNLMIAQTVDRLRDYLNYIPRTLLGDGHTTFWQDVNARVRRIKELEEEHRKKFGEQARGRAPSSKEQEQARQLLQSIVDREVEYLDLQIATILPAIPPSNADLPPPEAQLNVPQTLAATCLPGDSPFMSAPPVIRE